MIRAIVGCVLVAPALIEQAQSLAGDSPMLFLFVWTLLIVQFLVWTRRMLKGECYV